jgi:thiol:disulfide interchange protein DsbD
MLASLFSPLLLSADAPVVRAMFQENETVIEVRLPESFYTYIASPNAIALLVDIDEQSRALFGEPRYPQGTQKGEELIARGNFVICIPFLPGAQPGQAVGVSLRLRMQVCDEEQDLCYPPGWYRVMLAEPGVWRDAITEGWNNGSPPSSMEESITKRLARAGDTIILALLLAFAGGILASLTPCVYPVIPVIIGFFTQEDPPHSALPGAQDRALESGSRGRWRRFSGVLVFVLSMALVYTALGLTAGLIGGAFASFISTPPFFLAAALLFLFLALSLLDVFEFRLPFAVRNPSHRKRLLRAAGMGLIIGLIALPCVGPVIFFILTEIMQKGDMLSGAFLMLAFSLGMGVLFFALALLGKRFSDMLRAGGWMLYVKIALAGFVFMSALSFLEQGLRPLVSDGYIYTAKSLFLLFALWLSWKNFVKLYGRNTPFAFAAAGVLVALFIISIMPRAALAWGDNLDLALEEARSGGRKIFVDISAPWCALCRELEEEIMASGTLRNFIETRSIPLRLDYDTNEERLARDYDVRSLPCVLVLDADGQVIWRRGGGGVKSLAAELSNVLE